jgi:predicted Zn-dependent protease
VSARIAILVMISGALLPGQEPLGSSSDNVYSLEKEAALGKQLAGEIRHRSTPIDNPVILDYLERLGRRIAAQISNARFPFTFSVIVEDRCGTHEPAALPGGYLFVPAALFTAAEDEAEFAGMVAHAMQHVVQRHGTRQATRGVLVNYATVPLIFMGGTGGCTDRLAVPAGFLKLQRQDEMEADALAIRNMAQSGFDPKALIRYVERVHQAESRSEPRVPVLTREERLAGLKAAIEALGAAEYAEGSQADFLAARREVELSVKSNVRSKTPPSLVRNRQ